MYLALLKENEKEQFLSLAVALACTDGDFGKEEHFMITLYCDEMGVEDHIPTIADKNLIIDEVIKNSEIQNKKIFIFELIGLAMADNSYEESERTFLNDTAVKFGLNENYVKNCENIISEYLQLQNKINNLVIG